MTRLNFHLSNPLSKGFQSSRSRVKFVMILLALWLLALVWRAVDLQVLQHDALAGMAQRQSQRIIKVKGKRGAIYDSQGHRLAASLKADSFFAHPSRIREPALAAHALSRALAMPREILEARLRSTRAFVWLKRQVTPEEAEAVWALKLKGVGSTSEYRRVYPARSLAASLLGFTGVDTQGLEGLEYAYDSYLRGAERTKVVEVDALGRAYLRSGAGFPTGGGSLQLTIHPAIQYLAEKELARAVETWEAKVGIAIVMRSRTGEILAMAQAPGFNPNAYQDYEKYNYFNRAITSGYEPGSTFKVITAAIALDSGSVRPDSLFFCEEGLFEHYDSLIHDTKPYGWLTLDRVIQVSSNICAAKVGMSMPVGVFYGYIKRFGFGKRLGVFTASDGRRLAGEAQGYTLPPKRWTPVDHAAISFGHGILVSPLQLTMAVNTIATGGRKLKPILVKEIRDPSGDLITRNRPTVLGRVITERTAAIVRDFMVGVVSKAGTGWRAALPGHAVAGKTGTTEKYDIKARGYSKTKLIASFVGFVPAYAPELTILVLVEEPARGRYGGVVAAPVFRRIAARALPLLGVWPEGEIKPLTPRKVAER
ncbi:MAG: penicillin-binding protein 2 [SAR324 cluster bacterium]|nr:penicillin-binding protein 2 [SAR324 cluster bacterium]